MNQKGIAPIAIILIIVGVLIVAGGVIFYFKYKTLNAIIKNQHPETFVDLRYSIVVQKDINSVQTGDTLKFTWNGCNLSVDDLAFQLIYSSVPENGPGGGPEATRFLIADNIPNIGSFSWDIPTMIPTGTYRLYLSSQICKSGIFADKNIQIMQSVKPFAVFISPKESESIDLSTEYTITWTSKSKNNVDLGYRSTLVGELKNLHWIAKNIPNNGSYLWQIPLNIESGWTELLLADTKTGEQIESSAFILNKFPTSPSAVPTILEILPSGGILAGSQVGIYGSSLSSSDYILFDGSEIPISEIGTLHMLGTISTELVFIVPPHASIGSHSVQVRVKGTNILSNLVKFNVENPERPSISYIKPTSAAVGDTVTVYGANFEKYLFVVLDADNGNSGLIIYPTSSSTNALRLDFSTVPSASTTLSFVITPSVTIGSHTVRIGAEGERAYSFLTNSVPLNVVAP